MVGVAYLALEDLEALEELLARLPTTAIGSSLDPDPLDAEACNATSTVECGSRTVMVLSLDARHYALCTAHNALSLSVIAAQLSQ